MKSCLAGGSHILQDLTLLLAQGRNDGQHALDKVTARAALGAKAALAPEHGVAQGPVELSEGIAPSAGLQNRACR